MPERKQGEPMVDYVNRCIPIRQKEHPDEDVKQSAAICYSMGRKQAAEWRARNRAGRLARRSLNRGRRP